MLTPTLTAGDTRPTRLTYKENNKPVDITGYVFTLKLGYTAGVFSKVAVIADGPKGILELQWAAGELVAGNWKAEMVVVDAAGKKKTHRLADIPIYTPL